MAIPAKKRKCRVCKTDFQPYRCLQQACSYECEVKLAELAAAKSKAKREKDCRVAEMASRKTLKLRIEQSKPLSYWADKAQKAVNEYIRARDAGQPCISCGKPATWDGQWHASHFRSVGAASAVRFNLWNIHKSCSVCNNWKSGNLSEYEPMLRKKNL